MREKSVMILQAPIDATEVVVRHLEHEQVFEDAI
jgi:hypothetical protein